MSVTVGNVQDQQDSSRLPALAMLNLLEDFNADRQAATQRSRAIFNILEDFEAEKVMLSNTSRAVINILEDLEQASAKTKTLNAQLELRVTERTTELARSEERLRLLIEGVRDYAIFMLDPEGHVVTWNHGAERLKGYREEEIVGRHIACFYPEETATAGKPTMDLSNAIQYGSYEDEGLRVRKDGSRFMASVIITPVFGTEHRHLGFAAIIRDISERIAAQAEKLEAVRREVLLKEIHHRVKNNLAVIGSLFFLQSTYTQDPQTLRILQECQDRVRSMALIHERLYRSGDLSTVDFAEYTKDLVGQLFQIYVLTPDNIRLQLDLGKVELDIDRALPLGLILNELVSNSLKHAFVDGRNGTLHIFLREEQQDGLSLAIIDDGVGLPPDETLQDQRSLGMRLIHSLTIQLNGRIEFIRRNPGTEARLTLGG